MIPASCSISHNLGVVARVCTKVGVMYAGEMVERASVGEIFKNPQHPYTQVDSCCVPKLGASKANSLLYPDSRAGAATGKPARLHFAPRCDYVRDRCRAERPSLRYTGGGWVRCHFAEEIDPGQWTPSEGIMPPKLSARSPGRANPFD
ncbi:MAG: oligopeptide/dipeptide ABC transporter ATP-binding protein [Anaerolineae bacterium]